MRLNADPLYGLRRFEGPLMSLNWNIAFGVAFLLLGCVNLYGAAAAHMLPAAVSPLILLAVGTNGALRSVAVPLTGTAALAIAGFTHTEVHAGFGALWFMVGMAAVREGVTVNRDAQPPAASSLPHEALGMIALSAAFVAFPVHTHLSDPTAEPIFAPWFAASPTDTTPAWFPTTLFLVGLWGSWLANLARTGRITRR
jgi:hypothetical protein